MEKVMLCRRRDKKSKLVSPGQVLTVELDEKKDKFRATIKIDALEQDLEHSWSMDFDERSPECLEIESLLGQPMPERFDPKGLEKRRGYFVVGPKKMPGGKSETTILAILDKAGVEASGAIFPKEINK